MMASALTLARLLHFQANNPLLTTLPFHSYGAEPSTGRNCYQKCFLQSPGGQDTNHGLPHRAEPSPLPTHPLRVFLQAHLVSSQSSDVTRYKLLGDYITVTTSCTLKFKSRFSCQSFYEAPTLPFTYREKKNKKHHESVDNFGKWPTPCPDFRKATGQTPPQHSLGIPMYFQATCLK